MTGQRDRREARRAELPDLRCLCANLRRAARLVSQLYETETGWSGVRITQFSMLQAISRTGTITHRALGSLLGLDQTTVSRSLATLGRRGWVRAVRGEDRRERRVALTGEGKQALKGAEQSWRRAQTRLRRRYGVGEWEKLQSTVTAIAAATQLR